VLGLRASGGCLGSKAPDEQLAGHFEELCDIARDNIETPERGVRHLGRYFGKHTEDMLGEFGATMQLIEKIPDDDKHDKRAYTARDRIQHPLRACERDWERFAEAVEADPEASALLQHGLDRIGRTFEIIFSGADLDFRTLPAQLARRLDR
jgi:hypothetical protein